MSIAHYSSPFFSVYQRSGTSFARLTNPSTVPTGLGYGVSWTPDGKYLSVGHTTAPYLSMYQLTGTTLTKIDNPATLPTSDGYGVDWSSNGEFLTIGTLSSPYMDVYQTSSVLPSSGILTIKGISRAGT